MKIAIWITVIVVVIGLCGYLIYRNVHNTNSSSSTSSSGSTSQTSQAANEVVIQNFTFSPAQITVSVGTTVKWTNQDPTTHKITSDTFNSGDIKQNGSYENSFDTAGTFEYHDVNYGYMMGEVVVQ